MQMSLLQIKEEVISQKKILEDANKIKIRILSNITINPMTVMLEHSILGIGY